MLPFFVYFCTMQNNYAGRMGWHIAYPSANGTQVLEDPSTSSG